MMTNDEIRALADELECWCEADGMRSAIHYLANSKRAIETLLARQAEEIKWMDRWDRNAADAARAILDPQPAATAEEKKNG